MTPGGAFYASVSCFDVLIVDMKILPLKGIDRIAFSSPKSDVLKLFGNPDRVMNKDGKDGVSSEILKYYEIGIDVYIDTDFGFIVWGLCIYSKESILHGHNAIGMNLREFRTAFPNAIQTIKHNEFKEYEIKEECITFFLKNDIVKRIDVDPDIDEYVNGALGSN